MKNKFIEQALNDFPSLSESGIHFLRVFHDPDCPKSDPTGSHGKCTCKSVEIKTIAEETWVESFKATRKARRKAERESAKAIRKAKHDA